MRYIIKDNVSDEDSKVLKFLSTMIIRTECMKIKKIQYFGETRFFDIFSQLIDEYREDSVNHFYSVDFHITTWDNDYTQEFRL